MMKTSFYYQAFGAAIVGSMAIPVAGFREARTDIQIPSDTSIDISFPTNNDNNLDSTQCIDSPDWIDQFGDGCDWYALNDEEGCPAHGNDGAGSTVGVANDNCCHCAKPDLIVQSEAVAPFPTPYPTQSPSISEGPTTTSNPSGQFTPFPTGQWLMERIETPFCVGNTPDWVDEFGDGCDWYEMSDSPGCPEYGNQYKGDAGVANDNCCYCQLELI